LFGKAEPLCVSTGKLKEKRRRLSFRVNYYYHVEMGHVSSSCIHICMCVRDRMEGHS
jgi:hypothetical protein